MNYNRFVLKNGLRVLLVPMTSVESATTLVMVGAGSRYEVKNNSGISHFLEHMAFKGTKKRPSAMEISSIIDGIGAESNAFTGKEITGYYIKSQATHVDLALDVLSDMLCNTNLLLDPLEIDKERGVILEELNLYEDTPSRKLGDIYESLLYGDTPMGWDIGGEKDVIRKITRDDFIKYMKDLYSASNMTVVVAGNIDIETTRKTIEKLFAPFPTFATKKYKVATDDQKENAILVRHKKTEQAHFALGVRTFGLENEADRQAMDVLASILGGGMSSRLFHEVREKRGLAYYVRSYSENYAEVGYLATSAGVDPKRIDDAIKVVIDEYRKILTPGEITEKEVAKAKEYVKGHFVLDLEDTRSVAGFYASQELLEPKIDTPEESIEQINKVTVDDVMKVAKKYLDKKPLSLALIGDFEDRDRFAKLLS